MLSVAQAISGKPRFNDQILCFPSDALLSAAAWTPRSTAIDAFLTDSDTEVGFRHDGEMNEQDRLLSREVSSNLRALLNVPCRWVPAGCFVKRLRAVFETAELISVVSDFLSHLLKR